MYIQTLLLDKEDETTWSPKIESRASTVGLHKLPPRQFPLSIEFFIKAQTQTNKMISEPISQHRNYINWSDTKPYIKKRTTPCPFEALQYLLHIGKNKKLHTLLPQRSKRTKSPQAHEYDNKFLEHPQLLAHISISVSKFWRPNLPFARLCFGFKVKRFSATIHWFQIQGGGHAAAIHMRNFGKKFSKRGILVRESCMWSWLPFSSFAIAAVCLKSPPTYRIAQATKGKELRVTCNLRLQK